MYAVTAPVDQQRPVHLRIQQNLVAQTNSQDSDIASKWREVERLLLSNTESSNLCIAKP